MYLNDYPNLKKAIELIGEIEKYSNLKHEFDAKGIKDEIPLVENYLEAVLDRIKKMPADPELSSKEPDDLEKIKLLRPDGPRRLVYKFNESKYKDKVEGAILGRFAGCTLGSPVECWPIEDIKKWAEATGDTFPPSDYWNCVKTPFTTRYIVSTGKDFTRTAMNCVPPDDDIIYTILGLMTLEKYGINFKTENVGDMWDEYLPWIWHDMKWPLDRYRSGIPALNAADDNPLGQMICGYIRCDPYGYAVPGYPEKAAELAYRDAYMSHRRNGIYGAMFFAAAISAAFISDDPIEAVKIGLTEIPRDCTLAKAIHWALEESSRIKDYQDARNAVDEHFNGMHKVHTINNACLTVMGLAIGRTDMSRVISETVAMGLDNDCNAATAGSIVGAVVGKKNIPFHWYCNFNNKVHSYIRNHEWFFIDDIINRYSKIAKEFIK